MACSGACEVGKSDQTAGYSSLLKWGGTIQAGLNYLLCPLLRNLWLGKVSVVALLVAQVIRVFFIEVFERLDVDSLHHQPQHIMAALRRLDRRVPRHASPEDFFSFDTEVAHVLDIVMADGRLEHLPFDREDIWWNEGVQARVLP